MREDLERFGARRLLGIAATAVALAGLVAIVASSSGGDGDPEPLGGGPDPAESVTGPAPEASSEEPVPKEPRWTEQERREVLTRAVGQRIMTRIHGVVPSASLRQRVRRGQVGGVILFSDNIQSPDQVASLVETLQRDAEHGGHLPLLVSVDQEGGSVKRFQDKPPTMSAAQMGSSPDPFATALAEGRATAEELRPLGVTVNLAPVADVAGPDSFLGSRAFGGDPAHVSSTTTAFTEGLEGSGVAATAKHFPGLGRSAITTDEAPVAVGAAAAELERDAEPFAALAAAGVSLVMMSSASYPALDPSGAPAVLSHEIVRGWLRDRYGFDGVVISDDLETPSLRGEPDVATRAARAGVDILLYARTEEAAAQAFSQLRRQALDGSLDLQGVLASARRISTLKKRLAE